MHLDSSNGHGACDALATVLRSNDSKQLLPALRTVKNHIIGNKSKKQAYTHNGIVSSIIEIFANHKDEHIMLEAAVALGSFAYSNPEGLKAILSQNCVQHFIDALRASDEKLIRANLRALKIIYKDPEAPRELLHNTETLQRLVSILRNPDSLLAEHVAILFSAWCSTAEEKQALADAGAVEALVALLNSPRSKAQDAAAEALSALSSNSSDVAGRLMLSPGVLDKLVARCWNREARLRLTACTTLANVASCCKTSDAQLDKKIQDVARSALLVLVQLLHDPSLNSSIPQVLAALLKAREGLVGAAADTDAVRQLSGFLSDSSTPSPATAGALSSLGTLCMAREDSRLQLCEARVVPMIVRHLQHADPAIRCAAAMCVQALTRPLRAAKGGPALLDAGALPALVGLVSDASLDVQTHAVGAIANLVLDMVEAKNEIAKGEGLGLLVCLLDSMEGALRLQGTWALKNLTNTPPGAAAQQNRDVVKAVVAALPWASLRQLLGDPEAGVQVQAMALLRNFANNQVSPAALLEWSGGELLPLLEERLEPARPQDPEVLVHALFAVSNLSVSPSHRNDIMSTRIPALLSQHISSAEPASSTRKAAVWCIINLCWSDGEIDPSVAAQRVTRLRELGLPQVLQDVLEHETCPDIRGRTKHALEFLK